MSSWSKEDKKVLSISLEQVNLIPRGEIMFREAALDPML